MIAGAIITEFFGKAVVLTSLGAGPLIKSPLKPTERRQNHRQEKYHLRQQLASGLEQRQQQ